MEALQQEEVVPEAKSTIVPIYSRSKEILKTAKITEVYYRA